MRPAVDKPRVFVDTNVLVYLLSEDERKAGVAAALLGTPELTRIISTQVISEFVHTVRRKTAIDWSEVREYVDVFRDSCFVEPIGHEEIDLAIEIADSLRYQWYDSLIVAAALHAGATVLYSEDLQDRRRIETLTIVNPFRAGRDARF